MGDSSLDEYDVESIVLGDGLARGVLAEIRGALPDVNVETVDERSTSEEVVALITTDQKGGGVYGLRQCRCLLNPMMTT